jgi:hypothetical protein
MVVIVSGKIDQKEDRIMILVDDVHPLDGPTVLRA